MRVEGKKRENNSTEIERRREEVIVRVGPGFTEDMKQMGKKHSIYVKRLNSTLYLPQVTGLTHEEVYRKILHKSSGKNLRINTKNRSATSTVPNAMIYGSFERGGRV